MPSPMAPKSVTERVVGSGWGTWILVGVAGLEGGNWRRGERIKRKINWRIGVVIGGDLGS